MTANTPAATTLSDTTDAAPPVATPQTLNDRIATLRRSWAGYGSNPTAGNYQEFTLAVLGLTERLDHMRLPGLMRQAEGLATTALAIPANTAAHPIDPMMQSAIERQVTTLLGSIDMARNADLAPAAGGNDHGREVEWIKPRTIWLVSARESKWAAALAQQLAFYGFKVSQSWWGSQLPDDEAPFAVIFLPASDSGTADNVGRVAIEQVSRVRARCPASQLFYIGVTRSMKSMVALMRAGIDLTVQSDDRMASLLAKVLDMVQTREQNRYRVLVVEDSKVAAVQIQRSLAQHDIESRLITSPSGIFDVIDEYQPDMVLMDMHMPGYNGVEATRVLRQLPKYQSMPIVYLSGETDVGLQVEALRLGGDHFLQKPFNPVLLAATVKTTIERHKEMRRASRYDGLTGLLNHTAIKTELDALLATRPKALCVAMLDIDHFKGINDTYGHPVGDQVIRSLGWLLKGRLRATDLIGRYGGEEFLVVVPGARLADACLVLDRIRAGFATMPHAHTGGILRSAFSAGIAAYPDHATSETLIAAADGALLEAKRQGRNRLATATVAAAD